MLQAHLLGPAAEQNADDEPEDKAADVGPEGHTAGLGRGGAEAGNAAQQLGHEPEAEKDEGADLGNAGPEPEKDQHPDPGAREHDDVGPHDSGNGPRSACLLYTSDAADDLLCVDLGGRRIIKKKKIRHKRRQVRILLSKEDKKD